MMFMIILLLFADFVQMKHYLIKTEGFLIVEVSSLSGDYQVLGLPGWTKMPGLIKMPGTISKDDCCYFCLKKCF